MFIGVPVRLGKGGVKEIVDLKLNDEESADDAVVGRGRPEVIDAYQKLKDA